MLEIGSVVDGKYKVLNVVGKGGMSVVYLVMNEKANKQWAIKEVRTDGVQDSMVVRQNLMADVNILKNLNHPHLPSIVDIIDRPGEGTFLIVMDYIEGRPLSSLIKENGAQSEEDVINWAKQLCDVFGYLHSRKPPIIYRDMKPSNIMLKPDGNIMVIDFGTAREYKGGKSEDTTLLGTKGYAAPEQYGGNGETDARTDIYNLGATMYHLLTGINPDPALPPYYGMVPDIREINPTLSFGISRIVAKCTANRPEDRYQSAAELYYDLENPPTPSPVINLKWHLFLVSVVLTLVMALGTAGFAAAHGVQLSSTYDSYMEEGEDLESDGKDGEAYDQYVKAIEVDPGNYEAYAAIFKMYTGDDYVLTKDEYTPLSTLIRTNKKALESAENVTDYADNVALPLAEYLAFAYPTNEASKDGRTTYCNATGMGLAQQYLKVAKEYASSEKNKELASLIYEVSESFEYIGEEDVYDTMGNLKIDMSQYWITFSSLADIDIDNKQISVMIYNCVLSQISSNYNWFKKNQVTVKEISDVVTKIETALQDEEIQKYGDSVWLGWCEENINTINGFLEKEKETKEAAK